MDNNVHILSVSNSSHAVVDTAPIMVNIQTVLPEPEEESIRLAMNSDQPTKKDRLGFEPYVSAISYFLTDPNTKPPFTLSIEGKWGSGKSSFMEQLEEMLTEKHEITVSFNAWRHDKEESLWAAFALEFMRQVSSKKSLWQKFKSKIKLYYQRFFWKDVMRLSTYYLLIIVFIFFLYFFKGLQWVDSFSKVILVDNSDLSEALGWLIGPGGGAGLFVLIILAIIKLKNITGSPFGFDFNKYFKSPDYENRVAFIESFHTDFKKIVDAYAGAYNKIYIFIDDLDRCEVPKASDLMQAINLMISDNPRLIFIIGMDREKVAASIAVKNENLLPYLYSEKPISDDSIRKPGKADGNTLCEDGDLKPECVNGLRFGYEFIEKFIQVPFTVPVRSGWDKKDWWISWISLMQSRKSKKDF